MGVAVKMKGAKRQRKNLAVLLLAVCVAAGWVLWRIGSERGKIQQLCAAAPGKSIAAVNSEIENGGLQAMFEKGSAIVHGERTMGRVVCLLEYEGGAVTQAQFSVAE